MRVQLLLCPVACGDRTHSITLITENVSSCSGEERRHKLIQTHTQRDTKWSAIQFTWSTRASKKKKQDIGHTSDPRHQLSTIHVNALVVCGLPFTRHYFASRARLHTFHCKSLPLSLSVCVCGRVWTRKHWSTRWKEKNHLHLVMSWDDAARGDTEGEEERKKCSLHASNSQGHWNLDLNCMDDVFHRTMRQGGRKRWSDYSLILFSLLSLSLFFFLSDARCVIARSINTHCTSSLF